MPSPLDGSARITLRRAREHLATYVEECNKFVNSEWSDAVWESDEATREHVLKVKVKVPLPQELSLIAADSVNNLRSALDQCGYAVAKAVNGKGRQCYFPFSDTAANLEAMRGKQCAELPREIFDVMASFRPFKDGNSILWALNRLCNSNKHRLISPMAVSSGDTTTYIEYSAAGYKPGDGRWDAAKNEIEIVRFRGDVIAHVHVTTFLAFVQEPLQHMNSIGVLKHLAAEVDKILNAVETEAQHLGIFT
jgi:hypothetical protein